MRWISIGALSLVLAWSSPLWAQESEIRPNTGDPWILSVYLSTWLNRCDVPGAAQYSGYTPALGPSFALSKGPWRFSLAGYLGEYDFSPSGLSLVEGQSNTQFEGLAPDNTLVLFDNETAAARDFTLRGSTTREDLSFSAGYRFNNALQLGFSLEYNHRDATYWAILPIAVDPDTFNPDALGAFQPVPIEGDPQGRALVEARGGYNIHQLWLGPQLHGFQPLGGRFGGFYNLSVLLLAYESSRAPVYTSEQGQFLPPGLNADVQLPKRGFADNFGAGFSLGLSYSIAPQVAVWGGYSLKFFAEENTDILDHSIYQGPYFGVGYIFF